jgi:hypothetical protein
MEKANEISWINNLNTFFTSKKYPYNFAITKIDHNIISMDAFTA